MNRYLKKSRCGFVIIKFKIEGEDHFLMRRNPKWKDVNFIGGHEKLGEGKNLKRAARRELLEEVPVFRVLKSFQLSSLTDEIPYGPKYSNSANTEVEYILQFFLLKFDENPKALFNGLSVRSNNIFISKHELLYSASYRTSGLKNVLNSALKGGIESIPYSWNEDLIATIRSSGYPWHDQMKITFE